MKSKDQLLLEEAYNKIYLKENIDNHGDNTYGQYEEEGEYVPEEIDISENVPDGGVLIKHYLPISFFKKGIPRNVIIDNDYDIVKIYFDGDRFTEALVINKRDGKPSSTKISLQSLNQYSKEWPEQTIGRIVGASRFDPTATQEEPEDRYLDSAYEDRYSESFIHGIQPIVEAKKKTVNPYAVCTATVGRKDEEKYKSCKKKVAAGAKKSGKKVTNKPVKKK